VLAQGFGLSFGADPNLKRNSKLLWLMILGTIPAGIAGLLLQKQAETVWHNNQYLMGWMLIVVGIFMLWADRQGRRSKDIGHIGAGDAVTIGAAQAIAIIPGVSRSGITICAGLLRNLDRHTAARFSFLLSTPVIAAAAAKNLWDLVSQEGGIAPEMRMAFLVGILASAISGGLTIQFFLKYLRQRSLAFFVWYRVFFGIIVIALEIFRSSGR
jgi:undecaprenyl-diphosphatase